MALIVLISLVLNEKFYTFPYFSKQKQKRRKNVSLITFCSSKKKTKCLPSSSILTKNWPENQVINFAWPYKLPI